MNKILFVLLAAIATLTGCDFLEDNHVTEDKLESIFEYEFNENVRFYGEELSEHVSLTNDTTMLLVASMPSEHVPQVGDVILCPSTETVPRGFLRRVESIDKGLDGLTVNTIPATLADAFQTLQFEQTFNYAEYVKEFKDSLGNQIPFDVLAGSVMEQLDTVKANTPTKARGEADLGSKTLKFDISSRFFSGSAYIESQIYVMFDIGFGNIEVSYEIDKSVGLKGKAFISSSELGGTDYDDDFSLPLIDKYIPVGTPIGPPLMQFFPSIDFGIAFVGNGNMSLEGEVNYVLENTKSRYTYKNGVEHKEVINKLNSNSSWMKMVTLEVEGEFGIQGSVGMDLRLWNGDLLAFGGEAALWYGLTTEAEISMTDESLLISNPELTVYPKISAALYVESYFINNRKHRIEAKIERSFDNFDIKILPKLEYTTQTTNNQLTVTPKVEPICMLKVSEQGYALFSEKNQNAPITHKALPSSTIIDKVPTAPYVDTQLDPAEVIFTIPTDSEEDEEFFVKPYVVSDGQYYYGAGGTSRWVDLGLPSGILWAKYNVGASSPEEYGDYYAWGETTERSNFSWENYLYGKYVKDDDTYNREWIVGDIPFNISGTSYDAAHVKWEDGARMPTKTEMNELIQCCNWEKSSINNSDGYNLTGPNGNQIFLPMEGFFFPGVPAPVYGYYWSGTRTSQISSSGLYFDWEHGYGSMEWQCLVGAAIRPVKEKDRN